MISSFVFLYFPLFWGSVLSSIMEQEPLPSRQGKHYRADHQKSMSSLVCGADPLNHKHGGYKYLKEGSNITLQPPCVNLALILFSSLPDKGRNKAQIIGNNKYSTDDFRL